MLKKTISCLSLLGAILFFSGVFYNPKDTSWLSAFDFTTLGGSFGKISGGTSFLGTGGSSAKEGFLFALSLVPTVMLALGMLEIFTHYGAIRAAQKLMTPLLKPILGLPGLTGLAMITDLQSTDAGAALTKELKDRGDITTKDVIVMGSWQYSGAGLINNYFTIGAALFSSITVPVFLPLIIMFIMKFVGAAIVRAVISLSNGREVSND